MFSWGGGLCPQCLYMLRPCLLLKDQFGAFLVHKNIIAGVNPAWFPPLDHHEAVCVVTEEEEEDDGKQTSVSQFGFFYYFFGHLAKILQKHPKAV